MALRDLGTDAAKRLLRAAVARLPFGASAAVLDQASENMGAWAALQRIAPRCGLDALVVDGAYGTVEGSPADGTVLAAYARTGVWARRTNDVFCQFFSGRGGRYVDVGANIGLTTLPVARNERVACLAIEPNPIVYRHLVRNVARNCPRGNVSTRQAAAFSRRDTLTMEVAPGNLGDNRLRLSDAAGRHGEERWQTVTVSALPLDELVPDGPGALAVKIDTQGAEPFVFEGGARTLERADLLVFEWQPYMLARLGGPIEAVTTQLARSFREVIIAPGEEGAPAPPEPVAVAVDRLLSMAREARDDSSVYVDVIARR